MTWLQRYRVQLYVGNSMWIFPLLAMVAAFVLVRLLHAIEEEMGWEGSITPDTARAVLGTMAASMFTLRWCRPGHCQQRLRRHVGRDGGIGLRPVRSSRIVDSGIGLDSMGSADDPPRGKDEAAALSGRAGCDGDTALSEKLPAVCLAAPRRLENSSSTKLAHDSLTRR